MPKFGARVAAPDKTCPGGGARRKGGHGCGRLHGRRPGLADERRAACGGLGRGCPHPFWRLAPHGRGRSSVRHTHTATGASSPDLLGRPRGVRGRGHVSPTRSVQICLSRRRRSGRCPTRRCGQTGWPSARRSCATAAGGPGGWTGALGEHRLGARSSLRVAFSQPARAHPVPARGAPGSPCHGAVWRWTAGEAREGARAGRWAGPPARCFLLRRTGISGPQSTRPSRSPPDAPCSSCAPPPRSLQLRAPPQGGPGHLQQRV